MNIPVKVIAHSPTPRTGDEEVYIRMQNLSGGPTFMEFRCNRRDLARALGIETTNGSSVPATLVVLDDVVPMPDERTQITGFDEEDRAGETLRI